MLTVASRSQRETRSISFMDMATTYLDIGLLHNYLVTPSMFISEQILDFAQLQISHFGDLSIFSSYSKYIFLFFGRTCPADLLLISQSFGHGDFIYGTDCLRVSSTIITTEARSPADRAHTGLICISPRVYIYVSIRRCSKGHVHENLP